MSIIVRWIGVLMAALAVASCGGGGGGDGVSVGFDAGTPSAGLAPQSAGNVRVLMTDAPVCGMDHVWVTVQSVRIYATDEAANNDRGSAEVTLSPARRIDLATLTGGLLQELGTAPLAAGRYSQVRLILAENTTGDPMANAVQPTGGVAVPLDVPSGSESGLKVRTALDVAAGQTADLVLDFDACKSVVRAGNSGRYLLKPVITATPGEPSVNTGEHRVNTTTAGSQVNPDVAVLTGGGHVVVWTMPAPNKPTSAVFMQRYDASGVAVGGEVRVSPSSGTDQVTPSVAALADGGWVVTWASLDSSGTNGGIGIGIFAQRYAADGSAVGAPQQVNMTTLMEQSQPHVAGLTGGGYVVAWRFVRATSTPFPGSEPGVAVRRFAADGSPIAAEQVVATNFWVTDVDVAALTGGGFVVTWSVTSKTTVYVYAQRFDATGAALGSVVQVTAFGETPAVAGLEGGGYVVVWRSLDGVLQAQRYAADGSVAGAVIRVDATSGDQREVDVAPLANGGFVVTWAAAHADGSGLDVYAQRFASDGSASGSVTRVNTTVAADQQSPSIATSSAGATVITWMSMNQDGDGWGIYERLFSAAP